MKWILILLVLITPMYGQDSIETGTKMLSSIECMFGEGTVDIELVNNKEEYLKTVPVNITIFLPHMWMGERRLFNARMEPRFVEVEEEAYFLITDTRFQDLLVEWIEKYGTASFEDCAEEE